MTERTWKIRNQLPNGQWGPEREVTLAEYLAFHKAASAKASEKFAQDRLLTE